jgi:hypothetical protein
MIDRRTCLRFGAGDAVAAPLHPAAEAYYRAHGWLH